MGFPPGYNKQLVKINIIQVFKIVDKFQKEHYKSKAPQRSPEEFNRKVEEAKKVMEAKKIETKDKIENKIPSEQTIKVDASSKQEKV